ncbi:MAG TPA: Ig-like domain-containing protein [Elusimicrobiota bacterium]|nr:Ig-like domain-containing protein [Elusimicrobiota bacterium]
MISSKPRQLRKAFWLACALAASPAWAASSGGSYAMTKDLINTPGGVALTNEGISLSFAAGEPLSGFVMSNSTSQIISGYFGGAFGIGSLVVKGTAINAKTFLEEGLTVGVSTTASVTIQFTDQLDLSTVPQGIVVSALSNHLGEVQDSTWPYTYTYDTATNQLTLNPSPSWLGNTLYDVDVTPTLESTNGFSLAADVHLRFISLLDPQQENIVLTPQLTGQAQALGDTAADPTIQVPSETLSNFSVVLYSVDPVHAPLSVDPQIINEANQKAAASSSGYSAPLAMVELAAYDANGKPMQSLAKPISLSLSYQDQNGVALGGGAVRADTLSLWVLDQAHRLWVKLPDSANALAAHAVTAQISQFSVFAVMGAPAQDASSVYAFPNPWRPNGPAAGTGSGQTGTLSDGITFDNLPSECTIRIYTLSGESVRQLQHSDTSGLLGEEKWDGNTSGGEHAASGVYLWRVESASDSKNGKLIIIR